MMVNKLTVGPFFVLLCTAILSIYFQLLTSWWMTAQSSEPADAAPLSCSLSPLCALA